MISRQHVVTDFFTEAEAMRDALDRRFKDAYAENINWNYFCDPQHYAYLRAKPQEVIPTSVLQNFMKRLRSWCMESLGLVPMHRPTLHLMINGCRLGLHSDFHNGAWGYVYSLTRWDTRRFSGGETLIMRDGVPSYKKHQVHGDVLYELVPANFNQLLVFDDRIVHGTQAIEGSMDPLDGRIAMVGHIRATSPCLVTGPLPAAEARRLVLQMLPRIREQIAKYREVQGTLTYRVEIAANGSVESLTALTDNVVTPVTGYVRSEAVLAVKAIVQQALKGLRFPASSGASTLVVPVLIPIPDLSPIEFAIPHESPRGVLASLANKWNQSSELLELEVRGSLEGEVLVVDEPVAGTLRAGPQQIQAYFDPPMWVPSQRESFKAQMTDWIKSASAAAAVH